MRFVLLLFGGALIAAGAAAMLYGTDNVVSERGWSALISGATVFAAGAIIAALAGVVAKLEQVVGAIHSARFNAPVHSEIVAAAPIAAAVVTEAIPPEAGWQSEPLDTAPVLPALEPLEGGAHEAVSGGDGGDLALVANRIDAHEDKPAAAGHAAETSFDWLERALAVDDGTVPRSQPEPLWADNPVAPVPERSAKSEPAPPPSKPESVGEHGDRVLQPDPRKTPLVAVSKGEGGSGPQLSDPAAASVPTDDLPPTAAEPAILGRYQANGNSYVMFSDGSIEAVTQTGVYHFNSMAELKAFIEAQGAVSAKA
jgi:hypothetical protein